MKKKQKEKRTAYSSRSSLIVYFILRILVVLSMVRAFFRGDYHSVFMCVLSLVLLIMPSVLAHKLDLKLPSTLEIIIMLFIFAAEILGEINNFYVNVPHWDTMLHTINGFLCAAVGFALVDMLNRNERFSFRLSPMYLAIVAFCFSMTIGVLWEFFEFAADCFFFTDMQKDTILHTISTVNLNTVDTNQAVCVKDIADVILVHSDGSQTVLGLGGFLDIGLFDTMKDLLVNLIGAVAFSIIGFFNVKYQGKSKLAARFIPQVNMSDEPAQDEQP